MPPKRLRAATRTRGLLVGRVGGDRLLEHPATSPGAAPRSRHWVRTGGVQRAPARSRIVLPREKSLGWSLVIIRWVPHMITGTSGTPASAAIRTAPVLNSLSSRAREMVASGKMPTASPS